MTLFQFDDRLAPVRTGRYADAATSFAWLLGLVATVLHPAGLVVAGVLFALSATSVSRAVAAASTFSLVVGAGWFWFQTMGGLPTLLPAAASPPLFDLPFLTVTVVALLIPPAVGGVVRAIG